MIQGIEMPCITNKLHISIFCNRNYRSKINFIIGIFSYYKKPVIICPLNGAAPWKFLFLNFKKIGLT